MWRHWEWRWSYGSEWTCFFLRDFFQSCEIREASDGVCPLSWRTPNKSRDGASLCRFSEISPATKSTVWDWRRLSEFRMEGSKLPHTIQSGLPSEAEVNGQTLSTKLLSTCYSNTIYIQCANSGSREHNQFIDTTTSRFVGWLSGDLMQQDAILLFILTAQLICTRIMIQWVITTLK